MIVHQVICIDNGGLETTHVFRTHCDAMNRVDELIDAYKTHLGEFNLSDDEYETMEMYGYGEVTFNEGEVIIALNTLEVE